MNRFFALFWGSSALAGLCISFFNIKLLAFPLILTFFLLRNWQAIGFLVLFTFYGMHLTTLLNVKEGSVSGVFSIHELKRHQSPFSQDLSYRGSLEIDGKKIPCTFYRKQNQKIEANKDYFVEGDLKKRGSFEFYLKPKNLTPIENTYSLAELRYLAKKKLKTFLKEKLKSKESTKLLFSLTSGEVDDRLLRYQFSKVGLQHILAISGFHFGLLITFLSSLLGIFLTRHFRWAIILIAMSLYFLFIGSSPSIERAWLSASLFFILKWFKREVEPLNILGLTLLIELSIHPYSVTNLGFQLSYLSCFGIIAFFKPIESMLSSIFPKRKFNELVQSSIHEQIFLLASSFIRQGLSISFAVNFAILPILLFQFGSFPLLSLLYNLFYPHLISCLLFLFLVAIALHILAAPLATPLFFLIDTSAQFLIALISHPPPILDRPLHISLSSWVIPLHLLLLFYLLWYTKRENPLIDR